MIEFTILYKNGSKKKVLTKDKQTLIGSFSAHDASAFQEKVKEIHWTIDNTHFIESIDSGQIQEIEIFDGKQDFK